MLLRRRVVERGVWRVATWTHIGDESGCKGREAMGVGGSRGTRQQRLRQSTEITEDPSGIGGDGPKGQGWYTESCAQLGVS